VGTDAAELGGRTGPSGRRQVFGQGDRRRCRVEGQQFVLFAWGTNGGREWPPGRRQVSGRGGGADVESKDSELQRTPLSWTAFDGHLEVVKFLVEEGGAEDSELGQTPLSWEAWAGHLDVVKFLVKEGGATVESKDKWGNTALDLAR